MFKSLFRVYTACSNVSKFSSKVAQPLRSRKPKSSRGNAKYFVDEKFVRATGGNGGNGCSSFLSEYRNEFAGPDGGDGGNGGHVILRATSNVQDLCHITTVLQGTHGEKGSTQDCNGKCADHTIVDVPIGTVVKNETGKVIGDLNREGVLFVAARGGAGGRGNRFFITDTEQAPVICEFGAQGERSEYILELRSIAHIGLIGFPNAGKSTLLRAITRARPKVASYPFTTLKPHVGMLHYDDYEQVAIADLPGLIPDSHKNRGLGIQFLRHAERCAGLLYILDMSLDEPWTQLDILRHELSQFNVNLGEKPQLIIANKMDKEESTRNLELLKQKTDTRIVPISAKLGLNLKDLLHELKVIYDNRKTEQESKVD